VLKSLVIPKIIHQASYLPLHLPETFIKKINQVTFNLYGNRNGKRLGA